MSRRERKICANAKKIMKMQRYFSRTSGNVPVHELTRDTGFISWLTERLRQTGEFSGNIAIWLGNNALRAWNLYQAYRSATGQPSAPVPLIPSLNGSQFTSGFAGTQGTQFTMPVLPPQRPTTRRTLPVNGGSIDALPAGRGIRGVLDRSRERTVRRQTTVSGIDALPEGRGIRGVLDRARSRTNR